MRKHLIGASATLALVIAACGTSTTTTAAPSPGSTCVNASAAHHAYVVVQHLSGATLQRCVGFAGDTIGGEDLFRLSAIEYQSESSSFGNAACQIDHEPAQFTKCFEQGKPYWSLWVESSGAWLLASLAYNNLSLGDKAAMGWHLVSSSDPSPGPPPLAKES